MKLLIIHGANVNQMGEEPVQLNGSVKLDQIEKNLIALADEIQIEIKFFQSNIEGDIVNAIHHAKKENFNGILINAGSYSQTSVAISDAIKSVLLPTVEIILGNITLDSTIKTVISPACIGLITGFGPFAYHMGLLSLHNATSEIKLQEEQMKKQQMMQQQGMATPQGY